MPFPATPLRTLNSPTHSQRQTTDNGQWTNRTIRTALLRWYNLHARPLPWRKSKNPYKVWISEVMLQQTQVATVIPYYRRFLRAFPTTERLARARLERVLELWSGLGYYRRARNLHKAAQIIGRELGGCFPRQYDRARSLPGIGDYTARAVLSIAYNLPYTVLDGNVARVIARLRARRGSLSQSAFRRAVEGDLDNLVSKRQPGNFNQALMELGQTVCLPRAPHCPLCPLKNLCRAYRYGVPELYPAARPRHAMESLYLAAAVISRGPNVALMRGLDEGLLPDLWNFPAAFGQSRAAAFSHLQQKLGRIVDGTLRWRPSALNAAPPPELRHGITHRSIRVHLYPAEISGSASDALRWIPITRLPQAAVSQLARKIAARIADQNTQNRPFVPPNGP